MDGSTVAGPALAVLVVFGLVDALLFPERNCYDPVKRTQWEIDYTARKIDSFAQELNRLPASLEEMTKARVDEREVGPFLHRKALSDRWGRALLYRPLARAGAYEIRSLGEDAAPGGEGADRDLYVTGPVPDDETLASPHRWRAVLALVASIGD
jgi:general secretion pathway protein G